MKHLAIACLLVYRKWLSPLVGGGCIYSPSCSVYALDCVRRYGAWTGWRLILRRLLRCDGAHRGGEDPVPEPHEVEAALGGELVVVGLLAFDLVDETLERDQEWPECSVRLARRGAVGLDPAEASAMPGG